MSLLPFTVGVIEDVVRFLLHLDSGVFDDGFGGLEHLVARGFDCFPVVMQLLFEGVESVVSGLLELLTGNLHDVLGGLLPLLSSIVDHILSGVQ